MFDIVVVVVFAMIVVVVFVSVVVVGVVVAVVVLIVVVFASGAFCFLSIGRVVCDLLFWCFWFSMLILRVLF